MIFLSRASRRERAVVDRLKNEGFDAEYYCSQLNGEGLNGLDPAVHFHRIGWKQGLNPNDWFVTEKYLSFYDDVNQAGVDPFFHYLEHGRTEGRSPGTPRGVEIVVAQPGVEDRPPARAPIDQSPKQVKRSSPRVSAEEANEPLSDEASVIGHAFDLDFYNLQVPGTTYTLDDAIAHYLASGARQRLDPHPAFSTASYVNDNPDVAKAGVNPYWHFLAIGRNEARQVRPSSFSIETRTRDGITDWQHYEYVKSRGLRKPVRPLAHTGILDFTIALAGSDLVKQVMSSRMKTSWSTGKGSASQPEVSVVIPCLDEAQATAECLLSVFGSGAEADIEIILVNNGSSDPFFEGIESHPDITQIVLRDNIGFGPAVNLGVEKARGEFVLLLNNDTQLAPGSLRSLLDALRDEPEIAIAGPKIISFDGRLQEAGVLLDADGKAELIGYGADPGEPRFNYAREVEHLSAACWLMRQDVFIKMGGFDDAFAPAYCEDADLVMKLRTNGYRLHYEPKAVVAHHLSKTTNGKSGNKMPVKKEMLIARNRAKLLERWSGALQEFDIRTIAFYLPQYHPIPENDLWWGKGFTEWRNLAKANPNFVGHRQPRYPADLGYYDLRVEDVMVQQAALARSYGVNGFCFYYYRFGEKRLLERPIEQALASGKPDFPFCLCWANENWSRRWDGMDSDILMEQKHTDEDAIGFAEDVARYFRDSRYITVNGKPLILIYRLQEIPNPKRFVSVCRNAWATAGFDDVMVAMVESFELSPSPQDPRLFGADITVEFPAHGMVNDPPMPVARTNESWIGNAHDYRELCAAFMSREEPGFKRLRSVLVGWDTTPRHQDRSLVLRNSTPGAFQAWLEWTYRRTREQNFGDERLVFINAWNEWCEGSYLEPDSDFGHSYLQAVKNAQEASLMGGTSFVQIKQA